jgi:hypothetical protein
LSGKRSPPTQHQNLTIVRSKDVLYIDRFTIILFIVANPLSELGQKTDSLCLLKLELLVVAIADPFSALANLADPFCLLFCDRHSENQGRTQSAISVRITFRLSGGGRTHARREDSESPLQPGCYAAVTTECHQLALIS